MSGPYALIRTWEASGNLANAVAARAIRTLPAWDMASPIGSGYRFARAGSYRYLLNRYALEPGDELEQRARRT